MLIGGMHFSKKVWGRTMIFSKNNSLFDILGKFVSVMIGLKFDIRKAVNLTEGWKDPVFEELRSKLIGKAKGYQV